MQPREVYGKDRREALGGLRQLAPGKEPSEWQVGELPEEHRVVMLVGGGLWNNHRVARDALSLHPTVAEVQAVVWVPGVPAKGVKATVAGALRKLEATPESVGVNHARAVVALSGTTLEWEVEGGTPYGLSIDNSFP